MPRIQDITFLYPHIGIDHPKTFPKQMLRSLKEIYPELTLPEVKKAAKAAYAAMESYKEKVRAYGREAIAYAEQHNLPVIVLAGRPYHIDAEITHGIDR